MKSMAATCTCMVTGLTITALVDVVLKKQCSPWTRHFVITFVKIMLRRDTLRVVLLTQPNIP